MATALLAALTSSQAQPQLKSVRVFSMPGDSVDVPVSAQAPTIEENKLTHVLRVTRSRGPLNAGTLDQGDIGRSTVEGTGFHLDTVCQMRNRTTGAVSNGLLPTRTDIRLTLMDMQSADIVTSQEISASFAFASEPTQVKAEPWSFMPNDEKVRTLRERVEKGMGLGIGEHLRQR